MKLKYFCLMGVLLALANNAAVSKGGINAGAAQREITPSVGVEIQHYYRMSVGVHDPLFARCLYLEDDAGNSVAVVCLDLILGHFDTCDQLRTEIRNPECSDQFQSQSFVSGTGPERPITCVQ